MGKDYCGSVVVADLYRIGLQGARFGKCACDGVDEKDGRNRCDQLRAVRGEGQGVNSKLAIPAPLLNPLKTLRTITL